MVKGVARSECGARLRAILGASFQRITDNMLSKMFFPLKNIVNVV
ncbi:MAG: hypothetical protein ACP5PQ_06860 [Thermoproteota archaeon]